MLYLKRINLKRLNKEFHAMHKFLHISLAFTGALLSANLLVACGDDNSSAPLLNQSGIALSSSSEQATLPSSATEPASSDTQTQPESSATPLGVLLRQRLGLQQQQHCL